MFDRWLESVGSCRVSDSFWSPIEAYPGTKSSISFMVSDGGMTMGSKILDFLCSGESWNESLGVVSSGSLEWRRL